VNGAGSRPGGALAETGPRATAAQRMKAWEQFYQALFGCMDFRNLD
jgi:hypothetical protein